MNVSKTIRTALLATALLLVGVLCTLPVVQACPFCSSVGLTFTDQMASQDVVLSAKLLKTTDPDPDSDELPQATFEIEKIFRGKELVKLGMKFEASLVGRYDPGEKFFVMGVNPPQVKWSVPMKVSDRALDYLGKLDDLPEKGADRLAYFQDFFEDEDPLLAFDAYDEFAKAPYSDLIDLKDRMDRERLIKLINNDRTSPNRRRLYFTMLGVCGQEEDARMLEGLLLSGSRRKTRGLEALIACYLNLKGDSGMDLIQRKFFEDKDCEFTSTMLAMQALRFHAEETDVISKDLIVAAARKVLDNKEARDMVIPDLARWEDWSVMEKLVRIFKDSSEDDSTWIRVPIATYLMACPLPKAKQHLEDLKKIDGKSIKRAKFLGEIDFDDFEDEDDDEEVSVPAPQPTEFVSIEGPPQVSRHVVKKVEQPSIATDEEQASANPVEQTFVSTSVTSNQSAAVDGSAVARATQVPAPKAPVAAVTPRLTWQIIFVPMGVSVVLFILLWSVLSGWFERLIF